jgi:hypothetical protein
MRLCGTPNQSGMRYQSIKERTEYVTAYLGLSFVMRPSITNRPYDSCLFHPISEQTSKAANVKGLAARGENPEQLNIV